MSNDFLYALEACLIHLFACLWRTLVVSKVLGGFFVSSDTDSYPDGTSRKFEDTEVVVLSLEDSRRRFFTPNFSGDHFFLTISG